MNKEEMNSQVMTMTTNSPQIKRVDLVDGGRNGLKVSYHTLETRNGVVNGKDSNDKWHRPAQQELRDHFADLKEHLLRQCGYYWNNKTVLELYKNNLEVTYIVYDRALDKFQLGGKMKVGGHEKEYTVNLNSANVMTDSYDDGEIVINLFNKITEEAKLFMLGLKGAKKQQIIYDYLTVKKQSASPEDDFNKMTDEERERVGREAFENFGLTVVEEDGKMVLSIDEEQPQGIVGPEDSDLVPAQVEETNDLPFNI